MKNDNLRIIPQKNYIILGIVIFVTLLLLYYFYMWIDAYNETKLNRPILDKYLEVINYNELEDYLMENQDTIIYVSVLENSKIRDFEKQFKSALRKKEIDKDILYMNITEDIKNKAVVKEMKEKYVMNSLSIYNVPVITVFEDGILKNIYNIKDNDYDIERFKLFINNISFNSDGEVNG